MSKRGMLIIVSGPSGVGKDTVVENYLKTPNDCVLSVSVTTRAPRPGEVNGVEYHFVSREQFEEYINQGKMLEYAEYDGNYYGTQKEVVNDMLNSGKHVILIIETQGAHKVRQICKEAVFIFIMPPSFECLQQRLVKRQTESEEIIMQRLKIACHEIETGKDYDYIVINNDINEAVNKFSCIITAAECSSHHNEQNLLKGVCK